MKHYSSEIRNKVLILGILFFIMACSLLPNPDVTPTIINEWSDTPTPTITGGSNDTPTPTSNRCDSLSGEVEMKVLVGPSEAVGLEPLAVGAIPFSVETDGGAHIVQGGGALSYQDVLEAEWGTYSVEFSLESGISGVCEGDEQSGVLNIAIEMSGEQMVEVRAEGFQGDYPWSGTHEFNLSFPIEEGATAEGEGWAFVIHLNE
jgi:hypothetical protein